MVTRPASVTTLGSPLPPSYHSQIYAEARQSLLGTLQDLANHNPNSREILLESAYGFPGERGVDRHRNPYQDFALVYSELTVAHPETLQDAPQELPYTSYPGAAYICFYPYPGNPVRDYTREPVEQEDSPPAPPADPYDDPPPRFRSPTPSWLGPGQPSPSPPPPSSVAESVEACLVLPDSAPSCFLISEDTDMGSPESSSFTIGAHSELAFPTPSPPPDNPAVESETGPELMEDGCWVIHFPQGHVFMSRTPTGWIAEFQERPPQTLTLPSPPASPESENPLELKEGSSTSNLILLANAAEVAAGNNYPHPFEAISYAETSSSDGSSDTSETLDDITNLPTF